MCWGEGDLVAFPHSDQLKALFVTLGGKSLLAALFLSLLPAEDL